MDRISHAIYVISFQFIVKGFQYGQSALVMPMAAIFAENGNDISVSGGVVMYGFFYVGLLESFTSALLAGLARKWPNSRGALIAGAMIMWPVALILMAVGAALRSTVVLALAYTAMVYPAGMAICIYQTWSYRVWGDSLWKIASMRGFASGLGALCWTLVLGETIAAREADGVPYTIAIMACASGAIFLIAYLFASAARANLTIAVESYPTAESIPSGGEVLRNWRAMALMLSQFVFGFFAPILKMFHSTLFEQSFSMTHRQSTHYAAACLGLFIVVGGLSPLFSTGRRVFLITNMAVAIDTVASVLSTPLIASGAQSSLFFFVALRLLSGGGFAAFRATSLLINKQVLGVAMSEAQSILFQKIAVFMNGGPAAAWLICAWLGFREGFTLVLWSAAIMFGLVLVLVIAVARSDGRTHALKAASHNGVADHDGHSGTDLCAELSRVSSTIASTSG